MIKNLHIYNLRNIIAEKILFESGINVIYGDNGSGKSTVLEALYILGSGNSYRAREASLLIKHDACEYTVFAKTFAEKKISVQKNLKGSSRIKIDSESYQSSSSLAYLLPTQIIYQDVFQIIDSGSAKRRNLLNWGCFHLYKQYLKFVKQYNYNLKQRNFLLRHKHDDALLFNAYENNMAQAAHEIDLIRQSFYKLWQPLFHATNLKLTDKLCDLEYYKGWKDNIPLEKLLHDNRKNDKRKGFTQFGPHSADLIINVLGKKARHNLSRGQQKMVLTALKFSQAELVDKNCLYLIDDICSETDNQHLSKLLSYISSIKDQVVITAINKDKVFEQLQNSAHYLNIKDGKISS